MSVEAIAWVLHHADTSGTDKVVLIGLANHADPYGANSWPSVDTLATYAGVTERAVRAALRRLEAEGRIACELQAGGDRHTRPDRRPNRYRILGMDGRKPTSPREPVDNPPDGRKPTSGRDSNGGKPSAPRGEVERRNGGKPASPEPSLNHPINARGDELSTEDLETDLWRLARTEAAAKPRVWNVEGMARKILAEDRDRLIEKLHTTRTQRVAAEQLAQCPNCTASGWVVIDDPDTGEVITVRCSHTLLDPTAIDRCGRCVNGYILATTNGDTTAVLCSHTIEMEGIQ